MQFFYIATAFLLKKGLQAFAIIGCCLLVAISGFLTLFSPAHAINSQSRVSPIYAFLNVVTDNSNVKGLGAYRNQKGRTTPITSDSCIAFQANKQAFFSDLPVGWVITLRLFGVRSQSGTCSNPQPNEYYTFRIPSSQTNENCLVTINVASKTIACQPKS